jgi:hypothetical protein
VNNAWHCKEEFTPDGKRRIRRERSIGDSVVVGIVAMALLIVVLILVLTGHATMTEPISLAPLVEGLRRWFR